MNSKFIFNYAASDIFGAEKIILLINASSWGHKKW